MRCRCLESMTLINVEKFVNLGVRGEFFIEEHYVCKSCKLKGAKFTRMNDVRRKSR